MKNYRAKLLSLLLAVCLVAGSGIAAVPVFAGEQDDEAANVAAGQLISEDAVAITDQAGIDNGAEAQDVDTAAAETGDADVDIAGDEALPDAAVEDAAKQSDGRNAAGFEIDLDLTIDFIYESDLPSGASITFESWGPKSTYVLPGMDAVLLVERPMYGSKYVWADSGSKTRWFKDGKEIKTSGRIEYADPGDIAITGVTAADFGEYRWEMTIAGKKYSGTAVLYRDDPEQITDNSVKTVQLGGERYTKGFKIVADRSTEYKIRVAEKNGYKLEDDGIFLMVYNADGSDFFDFTGVEEKNGGLYTLKFKKGKTYYVYLEDLDEVGFKGTLQLVSPALTGEAAQNVDVKTATLPLKVKQSVNAGLNLKLDEGDKAVSVKTSNSKIVKVSGTKIKGVKKGTATVTVTTKDGFTASYKVKVQKGKVAAKLAVSCGTTVNVEKGDKFKIGASKSPVTCTYGITYKTSNKKVATVTKAGVVTAKKKGTAKITVKCGSAKKVIAVKVTEPPQASTMPLAEIQKQLLESVNSERVNSGAQPLVMNSELNRLAQIKAENMYKHKECSHESPELGMVYDQYRNAGLTYWAAGENIAYNQRTIAEVMNAWMNSEGHRANILLGRYNNVGFGYYKGYWVQQFAEM